MEQVGEWGIVGRQRVEAMVQTLASLGSRGESLAEVAHDARNMVTALGLYCDLLEEPGVLAVPFAHYGHELRLVASASRRLVEKLVALDAQADAGQTGGIEMRGASIMGAAGMGAAGTGSVGSVGPAGWPAAAGADAPSDGVAERRVTMSLSAGAGPQDCSLDQAAVVDPSEPDSLKNARRILSSEFGPDSDPGLETGLENNLDRDHGRDSGAISRANGFTNPGGTNLAGTSLDTAVKPGAASGPEAWLPRGRERGRLWETMLSVPVDNLAAELLANRNLLSALAGPGIAVTVDAEGGARPVRLTAEDLTRLLVNLVKNASEAIPTADGPGHIQISLRECAQANGTPASILLAIEDNGPGIPQEELARVFDSGFSTHARNAAASNGWPVLHRGLGLAIARSLVEAAGGRITASNREQGGARIALELPVRAA
jgi:two-component sensor histidine kinase